MLSPPGEQPHRYFYYWNGREARRLDRKITDCPYLSKNHAAYWWQRGWSDEDVRSWDPSRREPR
jgi:hypothetical protein